MKSIKNSFRGILNLIGIGGLIQLKVKSSLLEKGWFRSFDQKEAVDANGNPIAWCTYPFLDFIYPRLQSHFKVFEYGCGNSTIWYAKKVESITSVEHEKGWLDKIQSKMPKNSTIVYKELEYDGLYSKEIKSSGTKYHIAIVDGRDRNNCLLNAMDALTDDGIIVFDNSYLPQYQSSINTALSKGFRKIDFYGMGPIAPHTSCTSIIYRTNNCLGI
jgi:hypothetical protein